MFYVGQEIDFYEIKRKKEMKKITTLLILNIIAAAYLIFALTL